MTVTELRNRFVRLTEGKTLDSTPEDQDILKLLNQALSYIGELVPLYDSSVAVSITGSVYEYPLKDMGRSMATIDTVSVDGELLKGYTNKPGELYVWEQFLSYYPNYATSSPGKPEAATVYGQKLLLVPTPKQVYSCLVAGRYRPAPLVSDSDEPDIPEHLHEIVAILAATLAMYPVDGKENLLSKLKDNFATCYDILKRESE